MCQCQGGIHDRYFENKPAGDKGDSNNSPSPSEKSILAECLRLVPRMGGCNAKESDQRIDEEESNAIRSLIQTELLHHGVEGARFQHPDPKFLLPLSQTIA